MAVQDHGAKRGFAEDPHKMDFGADTAEMK